MWLLSSNWQPHTILGTAQKGTELQHFTGMERPPIKAMLRLGIAREVHIRQRRSTVKP
jgi:hypothetical protein